MPTPATDLTTLAYVQAYMQDTSTAVSAALPALISAASVYIEQTCGRDFVSQSYAHTFNGSGNARLLLRQNPVTAVASVTICGRAVALSVSAQVPGFRFDQYGLWYRGGIFPKTIQEIDVAYTAGYSPIPQDLQQAVADMCNIKFKRILEADKSSLSMLQQQTNYVASELSPFVKAVISNYQSKLLAPL